MAAICSDPPMNAMAVLYPKLFLSSMRCLTCLPLRLLQFAPLSPSSSFPSKPSLNVISDFLTGECGFSSSQVTTVMRKAPQLLRTRSDGTAREAIRIFKDSGFTEKDLERTILDCPSVLTRKVDGQLKPKIEFVKSLGLASQDIAYIISHRPRILTTSLENTLAPRIPLLRSLFGSNDHLRNALRRRPHLLLCNLKDVTAKVEYVKNNLGLLEGSAAYVQVLSVILLVGFETLEMKTKILASFSLAEKEIHQILRSNPGIFLLSGKKVKENMDFLINTAGLMPAIAALNPLLLNFSLEKTLKPRYEFFEYLRASPHCNCLPNLVIFLTASKKRFLKRFGQYSTQSKTSDHTIS